MTDAARSLRLRKLLAQWRVAFAEFLLVPSCIIAAFLLLALATFLLDRGDAA